MFLGTYIGIAILQGLLVLFTDLVEFWSEVDVQRNFTKMWDCLLLYILFCMCTMQYEVFKNLILHLLYIVRKMCTFNITNPFDSLSLVNTLTM